MRIRAITLALLGLIQSPLSAETHLIDLSKNHEVARVLESGVGYTDFLETSSFLKIHRDEEVLLRFPAGRELSLSVRRGSFSAAYNDKAHLSMISLFTQAMPADEAANLMRIVLRSFGCPTTDVDRWEREVAEGKHTYSSFKELATSTGWEHYPILIFRIKDSQNPTYEWEGEIMIRWTAARYPDGWDEAQASIHNPKPPAGYERISLNPPSGRFYSRIEGIEIATGLDLTPEVENTATDRPAKESEVTDPTEVTFAKPAEESVEKSSNWWLWLVGAVVVVGGIGWAVRRKS